MDSYASLRAQAAALAVPLVVGIGCHAPAGWWIACRVDALADIDGPCLAIGLPHRDELRLAATLPCCTSKLQIQTALRVLLVSGNTPLLPSIFVAPTPLAEVKQKCGRG